MKLFGNHIQTAVLNDTPLSKVFNCFSLVPVIFSILTDSLDERLEHTLNKFIEQNKCVGSKAVENKKLK